MPRKLHAADCSRKPKYMFSFSAANYSLKLHKKYSIEAAAYGIITRHYIIRYLSARELVLPPLPVHNNYQFKGFYFLSSC